MKPLEDETDAVASQQRPLVRPQAGKVLAEELHAPPVGGENAAENGKERGLAAARRPGQKCTFTAVDGQINAAEHVRRDGAAAVGLGYVTEANRGRVGGIVAARGAVPSLTLALSRGERGLFS